MKRPCNAFFSEISLEFSLQNKEEESMNFISFVDYIANNTIDIQPAYQHICDEITANKNLTKEVPSMKELRQNFSSFLNYKYYFLKNLQLYFFYYFLHFSLEIKNI